MLLGAMVLSYLGVLVWLPRRNDIRIWTLVLALFFSTSNLWKTYRIQDHLDSPVDLPPLAWSWQALSLVGCLFLCQMLSQRHWARWLWALQFSIAGLFLVDQLYERYFDDLPGLYLVTQISQARAIVPSAIELLRREDLIFVVDLVLLLPLLGMAAPPAPSRRWLGPLVAIPVLVSVMLATAMNSEDRRILRLRFRNVAAVQKLGLFHYHFYDVLQMAYSRWENLLDPDFDRERLADYLQQSRRSIQADTPWKGRYQGKNLLVFQLESFEQFLLHLKVENQEVTPFLNQLAARSWTVGLQDQSGQGRSSDGEFILLNSLLPPGQRPLVYAYPSNTYHGLPWLLQHQGYFTSYSVPYYGSFWNARYMARRYGFQRNLFREQLPADPRYTIGWGLSDEGLVNRLLAHWRRFPRPFFAYSVTLMGHHPYRELSPSQERLRLNSRLNNSMLGRYLQLARERDEQWRNIVEKLRQRGLWQESVVVLVGDHDARIPYEDMPLLGKQARFDEVDKIESDRVYCLIHVPDEALRGKGPDFACQSDLAPTLMHLMGRPGTPTAMLGLNLLAQVQRRAIVSKTGYALDDRVVVVDDGSRWTTYDRTTHLSQPDNDSKARQEMQTIYDLCRDILRLDLVPEMLKM